MEAVEGFVEDAAFDLPMELAGAFEEVIEVGCSIGVAEGIREDTDAGVDNTLVCSGSCGQIVSTTG